MHGEGIHDVAGTLAVGVTAGVIRSLESGTAAKLATVESENWLPGLVPQSVPRDVFQVRLTSLLRRGLGATRVRMRDGRDAVEAEWQHLIDTGAVRNRADLARRQGVSRARVTQVLGGSSA
jgi:hypothetical protein